MVTTTHKILVIDDDPAFLRLVERVLTREGYQIIKASDGQEGLRLLFSARPDLVLLDVAMPRMDGWQVCQRIREVTDVPVIMVTGKQQAEEDIVHGLELGADEYLFKLVGNKELAARVKAVLRRAELSSATGARKEVIYADGFLVVDVVEHKVMVKGERVRLTPREFRLLTLLVQNAGRVLPHKQILEKVWGWEYGDDLDYVRIYVAHLRQKIEPDPTTPCYIITESGVGYYFQPAS